MVVSKQPEEINEKMGLILEKKGKEEYKELEEVIRAVKEN